MYVTACTQCPDHVTVVSVREMSLRFLLWDAGWYVCLDTWEDSSTGALWQVILFLLLLNKLVVGFFKKAVLVNFACFFLSFIYCIFSYLTPAVSAEDMMKRFVAWDCEKRLRFAVPFKDIKPVIYLDSFLPRVTELALSSSDRQTKVIIVKFSCHCWLKFINILFIHPINWGWKW